MTLDEFKILVKGLKAVYTKDNFLPDADSIRIWYQLLGDIQYEVLSVAIQKYIVTNVFPPTIADLRGISAEVVQGKVPDWSDGWEQVLRAVRYHGAYGEVEALESMDSITRQAVKRLGYKDICMSENIAVDRANFRMVYEQIANREIEDSRLPIAVKTKIGQLIQNTAKQLEGKVGA